LTFLCTKSTGCSSCATVLLGVTVSGVKLKPFIIFKGKLGGRIIREFTQHDYPERSVYIVQEKAWIDKTAFNIWIEKGWKSFCHGKPDTYLIMDQCKVHLMGSVVGALQDITQKLNLFFLYIQENNKFWTFGLTSSLKTSSDRIMRGL
jgi:hypothetical protein